jgi:RNA polymerase sigma-70 factor (ECF subfamily)
MSQDITAELAKLVQELMVAQDKPTAFEPIFLICLPMARLYFMRKGLTSEADDLAQQTMWNFYKGLPRLHDPAKVVGFLYRIAKYKYIDFTRRKRRNDPIPDSILFLDPGVSPERAAASSEISKKITEAMARGHLTPRQHYCFEPFRQGYNVKEIAESLGITENAVKTHLWHARSKLRKLLEDGYPGMVAW